jgi:hypothetical protein
MTKTNIVRLAARAKSVGLSATIAGSGVRNVLANETFGKIRFAAAAENALAISGIRCDETRRLAWPEPD